MPSYDMKCKHCNNEFTTMVSIRTKEEGKIACPHCGSYDVNQIFKNVNFIKGGASTASSSNSCNAGGCGSCHACSA
ncbi:FmdB family zinc ribbon protein [Mahella sp.]|uniref:FmdB family zinc ribbon protein n=1 Tax=Mahella sp. TaxID=2798721 RepID=UPI0025C0FEC2|nr:FmdB family zinc ribbon protein [Mahella sp.]